MTRPLRIALLVCASCFILLARTASAASTRMDAPTLTSPDPLATSFVHLDVAAGASGAPYGFTVEWMTQAQFDANGDVWPDETDPRVKTAVFYGFPSLNTVDGTKTFMLAPAGTAGVEVGDI